MLGNPLAEANGAHKVARRMRTAKVLKWVAFSVSIAWGLLFSLFAAGYALDSPGGWDGVGLIAAYAVPMVLLALVAWFRPAIGSILLVVAIILQVVCNVLDPILGGFSGSGHPDGADFTLVLLVALACLGVHRARLAGALLVALAVLPFAAGASGMAAAHPGEAGIPLPVQLGFWMVPFGLPTLLVGILFFVSGSLAGERLRLGR